jgi:ArsR family transcriptional regulator, virulence genes transcriptional regulator
LSTEFFELHASMCGVFASPRRLEIINLLSDKELTVSEILRSISITKTNLSQHLSIMKNRNIVRTRRQGQHIYYSIANKKILEAYKLMSDVLHESLNKRYLKITGKADNGTN